MPDPATPPGMTLRVARLDDGRWCCVATMPHPTEAKLVALTLGTGTTEAEAIADCRNDLPVAIREFRRAFGEAADA